MERNVRSSAAGYNAQLKWSFAFRRNLGRFDLSSVPHQVQADAVISWLLNGVKTMIDVTGLTRKFGDLTVVDDLSFRVEDGEILGFLGPNGAGKSTTMKMLTGFLAPSAGEIRVFDYNVATDPVAVKRNIGYLPEGAPAYSDMSVSAFLHFASRIRGLKGEELTRRMDDVIQKVDLGSVLTQRIETLSKGFKRRVGLAQALLHDPRILILDEPTDGLDPNQKHQVRELIRNLSRDKIVIISTHILEEVHAVCTRALIIASGRIVADGTPEELASMSRYHEAVRIRFVDRAPSADEFLALPDVADVSVDRDGLAMTIFPQPGGRILPAVNELLRNRDWDVEEFFVEQGRLDDVFRKVTTGEAA